MVDKIWKRYGMCDIGEFTILQIQHYAKLAINCEEREDLERKLETVALTGTAYHGTMQEKKDFAKKIKSAMRLNRYERQKRIGYERKGKILKPGKSSKD